MTNVTFPIRPQVARDPDGRITIYVGGSYQTMEIDVAMAMHRAMGEVLAISGCRVLTCVYCGKEYPQGTPAAGNAVLTDHIKVCEKHPLRKAEAKIARLRSALMGFMGVSSVKDLRKLEAGINLLPVSKEDRAIALAAIQELLDVADEEAVGDMALKAKRIEFLASLQSNHFYLTRNAEQAPNYQTASKWIEEERQDFDDVPAEELQRMKDADTIWCLHVYPDTPIGFWRIYGATIESVIDRAMAMLADEGGQ
ncbi:hypothetical protein ABZR86_02525 [Dyella marensis]|uniref:Uncharacterized protein n=1 Tax=Dyella marensis TaxID=500610 RepID=A0A1I1ZZ37_9GAMM|nr:MULTISPECIES: hypothetical protein [Dyella]SFE37094.1 hypothetical protein SAMN02799615_00869 [Dyella marensis]